ncbi:MAG TPA: RNA 2'-phosphotransferase [Actinoplanes sp.]|jgi:putative RNA 2'-phosphotransferase
MAPLTPEQVRLSRRLSKVLRHAPETVGLTLDEQGWTPVTTLLDALSAHGTRVTPDQLEAVVAGNDKSRFAVATGPDGVQRIRASQGHSRRVAVDLGLAPAQPPETLFHGTPAVNLPSITAGGLLPGRRHHVHLSVDVSTAARVGRRRSGDVVVLRVAARTMAAAGHVFHLSENGVWLTAHVPPAFLTRA